MLLERVNSPKDLKKLSLEELPFLCSEIRERIIGVTAKTGGHLASSLGAVELAVTLHYCLNTPEDVVLWDVGHQAYAHKIITGRNARFDTLRQAGGISGFPCRQESEYDVFTTGHASSAISLALGIVCGRDIKKENTPSKVVAVIGDGSLSGGLCFEGLNNAGHLKKDIIVVLNTNEMSIAPNVGALSVYLNKLISLPIYNRFHSSFENFVKSRVGMRGKRLLKLAEKFEEGIKGLFVPGVFFEELGFRYFGPFNGNDLNALIPSFQKIHSLKGPIIFHVVTKKGKGFAPAENNPVNYHSAPRFDINTGLPSAENPIPTYTDVFSRKLAGLAENNKKIVAVSAAMPEGTGLDLFRDKFGERFFDVGIAEGHAVCFASGLAKQGLVPVVAIYSTFLQRAFDQLISDAALQQSGVVFVLDRAGIVGPDGATHQGIFDLVYLRAVPNLTVMAPKDSLELEEMLEFAVDFGRPIAIRYPKDKMANLKFPSFGSELKLGVPEVLKEGKDIVVIAIGSEVAPAFEAALELEKEGISVKVINARFAKPVDKESYLKECSGRKRIITVEEGMVEGGFGSCVRQLLENKPGFKVKNIGLPCAFIPHGKRNDLLAEYGLDKGGIMKQIKNELGGTS